MSNAPKYLPEVPELMPPAACAATWSLLARAGYFPYLISVAHVPADGVRRAGGGQVPIPTGVDANRAWLVFIDLSPYAEWAHPCVYYFVDDEGNISAMHKDRYPPSQE